MSKVFDERELRCYNRHQELIEPAIDPHETYHVYVGTLEAVDYIRSLSNEFEDIDSVGYWSWNTVWGHFTNAEEEVEILKRRYAPFNLNFTF